MHAKEAHVDSINLLKCKYSFSAVGELLRKFTLKPVSHQHTCVEDLVTGGHNTDCDHAAVCFHCVEKVVDAIFKAYCQFGGWDACNARETEKGELNH